MEEIKLNVDEIIYDLKIFSTLEIEEAKKQGAEKAVLLATLALELIQTLQAEKEDIKNEYVKLDLEYQKLKTENDELKSPKFASWKIKFFKAQEEIERLTEENKLKTAQVALLTEQVEFLKNCGDNFLSDCEKLQKQVDELKEQRNKNYLKGEIIMKDEKTLLNEIKEQCGDCEAWSGTDCTRNPYTQGCLKDEKQVIECHGMLKGCDMVKQAVKETAKEIISLLEDMDKRGMTVPFNMVLRQLKERYGVEVE